MMVAGRKLDRTRRGQLCGFLFILRQAFVDQRAHHRAARRAAHALPLDRRPGVQDHVIVHAGDDIPGDAHPDQDGLPALDAVHHFLVGRVDADP